MKNNAVATHYAKALLGAGGNKEKLQHRLNAFEKMNAFLEMDSPFRDMLLGPAFEKKKKKELVAQIAKEFADQTFINFCFLLIDKGRFKFFTSIKNEYHRLVNQALGIIDAELITARPLENSFLDGIRAKLENAYQKKVELKPLVSPEIIGGLIIKIGNKRLDESVLERLSKLKKTLLAAKL